MTYPLCKRHKLLRTVNGLPDHVVSSAALHDLLGSDRYQEFIRFAQRKKKPTMGFKPEVVEQFLARK